MNHAMNPAEVIILNDQVLIFPMKTPLLFTAYWWSTNLLRQSSFIVWGPSSARSFGYQHITALPPLDHSGLAANNGKKFGPATAFAIFRRL